MHRVNFIAQLKQRGLPLRVLLVATLVALAVFSLTRVVLLGHAISFAEQSPSVLLSALALGALRDIPVAVMVASPWLLFELLLPLAWRARLRSALFFLYLFVLLFVGVSEGIFWDEFSVRFNFIALDYLVFTTEVIGNIRESYPVGKIVSALLMLSALLYWGLRRFLPNSNDVSMSGTHPAQRPWGVSLLLLTFFAAGFWSLKPPSYSANTFANELADNGWRSFIWAARQNQLNYKQFYATRPEEEVLADLVRLAGHPVVSASAEPHPPGAQKLHHRPNVVVVMMESMSAEFMATFGNQQGWTPHLDRLAGEGLLFTRLYAAGTRTVRGLEALSAALPPLPGKSVVRWENISNLNTLGSTLAARGWSPHFLYGGYGMFDNMNGFFGAQNYAVTDRTNFKEGLVEFENIWGVADEHLFDQVLINIDQDVAAGKPVFAHVMTASNHVPFTYPQGRIDIASPGGRPGGIKYADYAVGRFMDMAKKKPWFDNTIFLFVADHCARSAGKTKIPVYRYHIPAIIYAPKLIKPQRIEQLASQIDLAPTLLGLLGLEGDSRFVGRNILKTPPEEGRALLSTYQNLGYLKGNVLTVLQPKRKIEAFRVSPDGTEAQLIPTDAQLADEAIAYFQGAAILMDKHGKSGPAVK
jgi:phosphoglycerol transferase MdoB-like AlkP superfamily enzyme